MNTMTTYDESRSQTTRQSDVAEHWRQAVQGNATARDALLQRIMAQGASPSSPSRLNGHTTTQAPMRHAVILKYKAGTTDAQIRTVTDAFRALQQHIPGIISFETGSNTSPEGLNQGFTHVYVLTFEDAEARDTYLPHPAHQQFGALVGHLGVLDEVLVIDYTPQA